MSIRRISFIEAGTPSLHIFSKFLISRRMSSTTLQIETLRPMGCFYSWKYIFRHVVSGSGGCPTWRAEASLRRGLAEISHVPIARHDLPAAGYL